MGRKSKYHPEGAKASNALIRLEAAIGRDELAKLFEMKADSMSTWKTGKIPNSKVDMVINEAKKRGLYV